ncbi:NAD(P)/FAD-dependent oxidoreductase [Streptomyces mirabilis]|uniref:NAD(P)/FAD-dependent oxidoreductase n=1 Tax=Streptomyces mirabilis TaxID=68239 RepID=UPI0036E0D169
MSAGAGSVPEQILVVGASAGGLATAEALRRLGYGGHITLVGDESHLPYDRPPLSKQVLTGELGADQLLIRRPTDIDALGLELRLGEAAAGLDVMGRSVTLAGGTALGYDALVVATGVRPRRLPGTQGARGVHVVRTLEDAFTLKDRLRRGRRLVVVGAGFIGAEATAAARGLGLEVTLLEPAPVPLAHALGEQVGQMLTRAHRDHGVDLRTGVAVEAVLSHDGAVTGVRLTDGSEVAAQDIVVGIGSLPNTEWLQDSGLLLDNGLVCDEFSQAARDIYGVGDVARWHNPLFESMMRIEHRTNAAEQGLAVARNLLHPEARRPFAPVPYFWSDQYDMKIQAYGFLRGHGEVAVVHGDLAARSFIAAYRSGERLVGVVAVNVPPKTLRPWRAAIAARQAWHTAVNGTGTTTGPQPRPVHLAARAPHIDAPSTNPTPLAEQRPG